MKFFLETVNDGGEVETREVTEMYMASSEDGNERKTSLRMTTVPRRSRSHEGASARLRYNGGDADEEGEGNEESSVGQLRRNPKRLSRGASEACYEMADEDEGDEEEEEEERDDDETLIPDQQDRSKPKRANTGVRSQNRNLERNSGKRTAAAANVHGRHHGPCKPGEPVLKKLPVIQFYCILKLDILQLWKDADCT